MHRMTPVQSSQVIGLKLRCLWGWVCVCLHHESLTSAVALSRNILMATSHVALTLADHSSSTCEL